MRYIPTSSRVKDIRMFNRFYTGILGVLDRSILSSPYSLTEARVLFEIGSTEDCTATRLIELLNIDFGYLSRILKRFESEGLVFRRPSGTDNRLRFIGLTEKGKQVLSTLDEAADRQIQGMLSALPDNGQASLLNCMKTIEIILTQKLDSNDSVTIRNHRPGDAGYIAHRHGVLYAEEHGFGTTFEGYVLSGLSGFLEKYNNKTDRLWVAELNERIVGSIAIVGVGDKTAQLRWFLIEPGLRGQGLGKELMAKAIDFCREIKCQRVFLWTVNTLCPARHLYQSAGFELTEKKDHTVWGQHLTEERWDLVLV